MLLREVQARPLQGHRVRALRRGGHALQGPPRAHGPHRPRRPREPHLVLQGRAQPHRLPARHGAEGAGEGPVLRGLGDQLGGPRGARARPARAREEGAGPDQVPGRPARGAVQGARRPVQAPPRVPRGRQADRVRRRGRDVGGAARKQPEEDGRRGARAGDQGARQGVHREPPRHGRLCLRLDRHPPVRLEGRGRRRGVRAVHRPAQEAHGRRRRRHRRPLRRLRPAGPR